MSKYLELVFTTNLISFLGFGLQKYVIPAALFRFSLVNSIWFPNSKKTVFLLSKVAQRQPIRLDLARLRSSDGQ